MDGTSTNHYAVTEYVDLSDCSSWNRWVFSLPSLVGYWQFINTSFWIFANKKRIIGLHALKPDMLVLSTRHFIPKQPLPVQLQVPLVPSLGAQRFHTCFRRPVFCLTNPSLLRARLQKIWLIPTHSVLCHLSTLYFPMTNTILAFVTIVRCMIS